jgi:hypothetical protein
MPETNKYNEEFRLYVRRVVSRTPYSILYKIHCTKVEFCSTIYGTARHSTIVRLDVIQNSAIRIAFGARRTTPVSFLLSESGLLDLETRRKILVPSEKYIKKIQIAP